MKELCNALLNDDNGISEETYFILLRLVIDPVLQYNLRTKARATEGRYYLPEGIEL